MYREVHKMDDVYRNECEDVEKMWRSIEKRRKV
jgi:hypothetical protein